MVIKRKIQIAIQERDPDELWDSFCTEMRKKIIRDLTEDELLKYNPRLYKRIKQRAYEEETDDINIGKKKRLSFKPIYASS